MNFCECISFLCCVHLTKAGLHSLLKDTVLKELISRLNLSVRLLTNVMALVFG